MMPPQSAPIVPAQPQPSIDPESVIPTLHQSLIRQGGDPDVVKRITADKISAIMRQAGPNPPTGFDPIQAAYLYATLEQGTERDERIKSGDARTAKPGENVLRADDLKSQTLSQLPVLSTREEVAKYRAARGAGAPFIGPNGVIYKTH